MDGLNSCEFIGNLTKDVEVRSTNKGQAVCSFSIACNRSYTDTQGQKKEVADFVNVQAWGFLAEKASAGLKKGSRVYIHGRLNTRSYEAKDGTKKYITEIVADRIEPIAFVQMQNQNFGQNQQNQNFGQNQNFQPSGNFQQFGEDIPF